MRRPSSVTTRPFTSTRPSTMSCSDDAPARDARRGEHLLQAHALGRVVAPGRMRQSRSNPSWPSSSNGEMCGSSSSELMPRFVSSRSVVP